MIHNIIPNIADLEHSKNLVKRKLCLKYWSRIHEQIHRTSVRSNICHRKLVDWSKMMQIKFHLSFHGFLLKLPNVLLNGKQVCCLPLPTAVTVHCPNILTYLLFLDLCFHHFIFGRWRFLIGYELLSVCQPAEQRLQGILKLPTMQQSLLQLCNSLCDLYHRCRGSLWERRELFKWLLTPLLITFCNCWICTYIQDAGKPRTGMCPSKPSIPTGLVSPSPLAFLFRVFHRALISSMSCSKPCTSQFFPALCINPWPSPFTCCSFIWRGSTCSFWNI